MYSPLPQTAQAAEFLSTAVAFNVAADGPDAATLGALPAPPASGTVHARIATDCLNVQRNVAAGPHAMASRRRTYAGLMREAWADAKKCRGIEVFKVKAHQLDADAHAMEEGADRQDAIGNTEADIAAKQAVSLHPRCHHTVLDEVDHQHKRARIVCRTVAKVLEVPPPPCRRRNGGGCPLPGKGPA